MTRRGFARALALGAAGLGIAAGPVSAADRDAMRRYVERVRADLARFRLHQADDTRRAGALLAERVAAHGKLWVYDRRGPYSAEAIGRAGGLMAIHRLRPEDAGSTAGGDAVIIVADEAADMGDIGAARAAKDAGAAVVGICPVRPGNGGLAAECHLALDNYATDEDAAVQIRGIEGRVGPTSGFMNTAILWALTAAYIEAMEQLGKPPQVWMSIKRPGAAEFNAKARATAGEVGY